MTVPNDSARPGANPALLNVFAVPLGLAGLAGVWQAMATTVSAPTWPEEVLFAAATAVWVTLTVGYLVGGARHPGRFGADRRHPIYGPFAAYIPVIGILLAAHYEQYTADIGRAAVVVFVAALTVLNAQLLAHWLLGNVRPEHFHPGYLLPTVAGVFIASIGLATCGYAGAADAAFGVGLFFWLVIGTVVTNRLLTGPPLPAALRPTLAVLLSAPAVAGIAWFAMAGSTAHLVATLLAGVAAVMAAIQLALLPEYRALSFTPNFWAFTFPVAASVNLTVRWLRLESPAYWTAWAWSLTALATAFVAAVAAATLLDRLRQPRHALVPAAA